MVNASGSFTGYVAVFSSFAPVTWLTFLMSNRDDFNESWFYSVDQRKWEARKDVASF